MDNSKKSTDDCTEKTQKSEVAMTEQRGNTQHQMKLQWTKNGHTYMEVVEDNQQNREKFKEDFEKFFQPVKK